MEAAPIPQVRRPGFAFDGLPRRWLEGRLGDTHLANSVNLLFPAGERFFVRSVRRYLDRIAEPRLRQRIAAFTGQEARHGLEHERLFAALEAQGYELASFLARYQHLGYQRMELAFGPEARLAATAALEHATAVLATLALRDGMLDGADPRARALLFWHAAEEIEHRSVAFDVLQEVDPRYRTRLLGFALALIGLEGFWLLAFLHLVRQDAAREGWGRVLAEVLRDGVTLFARKPGMLGGAVAFLRFLRPGFHPDREDGYALARDYLAGAQQGRWAERPAAPRAAREPALAGAGA